MALFSKKEATAGTPVEKKEKKTPVKKAVVANTKKSTVNKDGGATLTKVAGQILLAPIITEKALKMTEQSAYVLEVVRDATKRDIIAVVRALYNVTPVKVNIVNKQARAFVSRTRNRRGIRSGMKKAYIFLKKGEKIDIA